MRDRERERDLGWVLNSKEKSFFFSRIRLLNIHAHLVYDLRANPKKQENLDKGCAREQTHMSKYEKGEPVSLS